MKPLKSIYLFFIFILLLVLFGFYACKKGTDTTNSTEVKGTIISVDIIKGKWIAEFQYTNSVTQFIYQFNADGTFSQTRVTVDANKQPTGYQYVSNGKFQVNGDKLIFTDVTIKYDDYYVPLNQLAKTSTQAGPITNTIYVDGSRTLFHFVYPPCPLNADCVGEINYYKK